jgi:hypothetical protein
MIGRTYFDTTFCRQTVQSNFSCLTPAGTCDFTYSAPTFGSWYTDGSDCVDAATPTACCPVIQFGVSEYHSALPGNVRTY